MQSFGDIGFLELKALRLARRAPGADYPAYGARQQSASPYIEEFAGCALGKLLKGKIHEWYRGGAGPNHPGWLTIGVAGESMPWSLVPIPIVVLQAFFSGICRA
jgi:hypothetical protein